MFNINITPFKFWCQPILPLVYENELSYYEVLCKVKEKLNEVISTLNNLNDDIINQVMQIVNALEDSVNMSITELENEVSKQLENNKNETLLLIQSMQNQLEEQNNKVQQQLLEQNIKIDSKILELQNDINTQIELLKLWVNQNNTSILNYVDQEIQKIIDLIPTITTTQVINPITGKMEDVGKTIDFLTNLFRIMAEPAGNWDNKNYLTAEDFDESDITAWEWDIFGWDYLGGAHSKIWEQPLFAMRNPFTGEYDFYKNVIDDLFEMWRTDAFTALEYDEDEISAELFDTYYNPEAYMFDSQGHLYFGQKGEE